jgi:hypothetical protein
VRPALANIITARVPEADLLIDTMMVRPQGNRAFLISDTIRRLKAADIWAKLDVLWMLAAHDAQAARLNWKNPASFALTAVNSPTFTAHRGYAGNGTTSYLNTGWTPSTNAVQFTLNSGSLGFYINAGTDAAEGSPAQFGAIGGQGAFFRARGLSDQLQGRVNQGTSDNIATVSSNRGYSSLDRSGASLTTGYKSGASVGTSTTASVSLPTQPLYIGALNNGGAASNFATQQIALAFAGASLSAAQHLTLYHITQSHLQAVGAAV